MQLLITFIVDDLPEAFTIPTNLIVFVMTKLNCNGTIPFFDTSGSVSNFRNTNGNDYLLILIEITLPYKVHLPNHLSVVLKTGVVVTNEINPTCSDANNSSSCASTSSFIDWRQINLY
jgi:hypothetical protein